MRNYSVLNRISIVWGACFSFLFSVFVEGMQADLLPLPPHTRTHTKKTGKHALYNAETLFKTQKISILRMQKPENHRAPVGRKSPANV